MSIAGRVEQQIDAMRPKICDAIRAEFKSHNKSAEELLVSFMAGAVIREAKQAATTSVERMLDSRGIAYSLAKSIANNVKAAVVIDNHEAAEAYHL